MDERRAGKRSWSVDRGLSADLKSIVIFKNKPKCVSKMSWWVSERGKVSINTFIFSAYCQISVMYAPVNTQDSNSQNSQQPSDMAAMDDATHPTLHCSQSPDY